MFLTETPKKGMFLPVQKREVWEKVNNINKFSKYQIHEATKISFLIPITMIRYRLAKRGYAESSKSVHNFKKVEALILTLPV